MGNSSSSPQSHDYHLLGAKSVRHSVDSPTTVKRQSLGNIKGQPSRLEDDPSAISSAADGTRLTRTLAQCDQSNDHRTSTSSRSDRKGLVPSSPALLLLRISNLSNGNPRTIEIAWRQVTIRQAIAPLPSARWHWWCQSYNQLPCIVTMCTIPPRGLLGS